MFRQPGGLHEWHLVSITNGVVDAEFAGFGRLSFKEPEMLKDADQICKDRYTSWIEGKLTEVGTKAEIELNKADLDDLRKKWNVPETNTIAVGKTDVPGLEDVVFEGGSPAVRKEAKLPDLDIAMPNRPIKSPGKIASATRHAEEGVLNDFIVKVKELGMDPKDVKGTLSIHQSNIKGVCPTCIQGLGNPNVAPGIFKQFSEMFPDLTIKVTSETVPNIKPVGRLNFIIENGKYVD